MKKVFFTLSLLIIGSISSVTIVNAMEVVKVDTDELPAALLSNIHPSTTGSRPILRSVSPGSGINSTERFEKIEATQGKKGIDHSRYQQSFLGLPVWGEQVVTHVKGGTLIHISGKIATGVEDDLEGLDLSGVISKNEALEAARSWLVQRTQTDLASWTFKSESAYKVIYNHKGTAKVVYHVNFFAESGQAAPTRPYLMIDAFTGVILKDWEGLAHAEETATGPGGNEKTGYYAYGTDYAPMTVTQVGDNCVLENDLVKTVTLDGSQSGTQAFGFTCPENTYKEINGAYAPLNDAHFFGGALYNMFQDWFGIAPLDFKMVLRVHYGNQYENAFWDGSTMTFGDGRDYLYPLVDVNVVAHEAAHGFTEQNSGLVYYEQSGGINEAFSDMVGEATEYYVRGTVDWIVGADILKSSGGLRYFEDPTQDGISIGHADDYSGGMDVHHSSGVFNRAYFLIATSDGWDPRKALEVFVLANQIYWNPSSDFVDGACGAILAADELSYSWQTVHNAFLEVGVFCEDFPEDVDGDGMRDAWELRYGFDPNDASDAGGDADNDGLSNLEEQGQGTEPHNEDTDSDGLNDGVEVNVHQTDPVSSDTDTDSLPDGWEVGYGLDPKDASDVNQDLDGDGFSNLLEFLMGTAPDDEGSFPAATGFYQELFESASELLEGWVSVAGDASWEYTSDWVREGAFSLRSGDVSDGESASVEVTRVFGEGALYFDVAVDSEEDYDYLEVYLNGQMVYNLSGSMDWSREKLDIPEGLHTIRWTYRKDGSLSDGEDGAAIDNIFFFNPGGDEDGDGLTNEDEYLIHGTRLDNADTDGDGMSDYDEVAQGTDPLEPDLAAGHYRLTNGTIFYVNDAKQWCSVDDMFHYEAFGEPRFTQLQGDSVSQDYTYDGSCLTPKGHYRLTNGTILYINSAMHWCSIDSMDDYAQLDSPRFKQLNQGSVPSRYTYDGSCIPRNELPIAGDGVADDIDGFALDPDQWADNDGDGVGDNDDAFQQDSSESADSDGDNGDDYPDNARRKQSLQTVVSNVGDWFNNVVDKVKERLYSEIWDFLLSLGEGK